jgi:hypothetical protein
MMFGQSSMKNMSKYILKLKHMSHGALSFFKGNVIDFVRIGSNFDVRNKKNLSMK